MLAVAMHHYHDQHKCFPAHANFDADGKPLLSWRVLLLPYLEQNELYKKFHLDEPWDSAHNLALIQEMPRTYAPFRSEAGSRHESNYQVFFGPGAAFEGTQ